MCLTGFKKFVVVLMLMAFTGQLMAAQGTFCEMGNQRGSGNGMIAGMNHSMADMDGASEKMMDHSMQVGGKQKLTGDQKSNCCKTKGPCSTGGCAFGNCASGNCSLIGMNNSLPISFPILKSAATTFYSNQPPSPLVSSLYRPPIFG
jgi:hypothetical protein